VNNNKGRFCEPHSAEEEDAGGLWFYNSGNAGAGRYLFAIVI